MGSEPDAAAEIRRLLSRVGRLVSLMDLAREWGVSKTRVHEIARRDDFPEPIGEVATGSGRPIKLYALSEAQAWRDATRHVGRPPHQPTDDR